MKLVKLVTAKLSPATLKKRGGRLETDRERRARAYMQVKNAVWYEGHLGKERVDETTWEKVGPTYVWPEEFKTFLRALYPGDVQAHPNPGKRGPATEERPIVAVSMAQLMSIFEAREVSVAKRSHLKEN
eukprot:m.215640 g.215640  ORF g.215640 m.215640 type:complete len:129 (+) comp39838_c0_seq2:56-442(+)